VRNARKVVDDEGNVTEPRFAEELRRSLALLAAASSSA